MCKIEGKLVFNGIKNINEKLENIMIQLELKKYLFEIKLILSEAIMNAYIHGNKSDDTKPINISWIIKDNVLCIMVADTGDKKDNILIKKDVNVFEENGRGLLIISEYTDEFYFKDNMIVMKKILK